jgi:hypothetical protein
MPSVLSQALSDLQQTAENFAKQREEAQKLQAAAGSNRQILNTLVQQGIWGDKEIIEYNKKNDRGRNDMIAAGARAWLFKSQVEDQQLQRDAAKRAAEQLALGQRSQQFEEEKYAAAIKQRAAEAEAARKFAAEGAHRLDVPGTEGPGGIPTSVLLQPSGQQTVLPENPRLKELMYQRARQEEAKRISETKVPVKDRLTGKTVYVEPNNPLAIKQIREQNPDIDLKEEFKLRPKDMFNKDIHQEGDLEGTKFTPRTGGAYIAVANKPMPKSTFEEYQQRLIDAGMGPKPTPTPTPSPTPGVGWGSPISVSMPAWLRQSPGVQSPGASGGAAPTTTPTAATTSATSMKLTKDIAQGFADQAARQGLTGQDAINAAKVMAAQAGYWSE